MLEQCRQILNTRANFWRGWSHSGNDALSTSNWRCRRNRRSSVDCNGGVGAVLRFSRIVEPDAIGRAIQFANEPPLDLGQT